MDISEAVKCRKSIRAFKPDPVQKQILIEIMELALRAPSWANTQPYEFAIVTGKTLDRIKEAFISNADQEPKPELSGPARFPELLNNRRRSLGIKIFEIMGINREDKEKRKWWQKQGLGFFGSPCVIYIYIDRSLFSQNNNLNVWPLFDCGLIAENIMLLAVEHGLGSISQIQSVFYPRILKEVLGLPDSKLVILGIAIGYPDWKSPINLFRTEREPLKNMIRWYDAV